MRYRLLGPLVIGDPDHPSNPGGRRQNRLLAALLLRAGHTVPVVYLVEVLWNDRPPTQAVKVVRNGVSLLRTAFARSGEPATISTTGHGYRLDVPEDQLDLLLFLRLRADADRRAAAGDTRRAAASLRAALDLWRGPALDGLTCPALAPAIAHLDEQHLAAWECLTDIELRLGRADEVVGPLTELAAAHPLREHLHGRLMLALHHTGRRADALATYRALRQRLYDELGIDPDPAVRDLHRRILASDHTLTASFAPDRTAPSHPETPPAPVPRQLPAAVGHFIGRTDEMKALDALLDWPGDPTVVISAIDGSGGIGKTALALHWAHRIADQYPDGQLHLNLRGYDPVHPPLTPARAIRSLLDAFAIEPARIPADPDAQAALYRSLVADKRMLIVLDNARDAGQVRPLLPGTPTCLTIVTSRNRLTGLVATDGANPLTVDLLTTDDARDLLALRIGRDRTSREPGAIDELVHLCGRLPLALNLAAAHAAADLSTPLSALVDRLRDARRRLDALHTDDPGADLRAIFASSYRHLTPPAARMFRLLGLHPGADITVPAAASLAGVPQTEAEDLLAALVRLHLATAVGDRCSLHDLLRAYASELAEAEEPPHERGKATERILDHYLNTANRADAVLNPNRDRIDTPPPAPGVVVQDFAGYEQAWAWFESEHRTVQAAVMAAAGTFDTHAWRLAWTLSVFFDRSGRWRERVEAQQVALSSAQRLGSREAQAHVHKDLGQAHILLYEYEEAVAHLSEAAGLYASIGDARGQVRAHGGLAWVLERQHSYREALVQAERACELARTIGYRVGMADALNTAGWCAALLGEHERAVTTCGEALVICQEIGYRQGEAMIWDSLGYAQHGLGRHGQAVDCYRRAAAIRHELGDRYYAAATLRRLGDVHHDAADRPSAEAAWLQALGILEDLCHPEADELRAKLAGAGSRGAR
jgi:DNA-binding SARP family transcriptional activator/tetratricopeptide (TPR) repeat protein